MDNNVLVLGVRIGDLDAYSRHLDGPQNGPFSYGSERLFASSRRTSISYGSERLLVIKWLDHIFVQQYQYWRQTLASSDQKTHRCGRTVWMFHPRPTVLCCSISECTEVTDGREQTYGTYYAKIWRETERSSLTMECSLHTSDGRMTPIATPLALSINP